MDIYLKLMGCFAWFLTIITAIVIIIKTYRSFSNMDRLGLKVNWICLLLCNLIFGSGVGILFYQVAYLVKK